MQWARPFALCCRLFYTSQSTYVTVFIFHSKKSSSIQDLLPIFKKTTYLDHNCIKYKTQQVLYSSWIFQPCSYKKWFQAAQVHPSAQHADKGRWPRASRAAFCKLPNKFNTNLHNSIFTNMQSPCKTQFFLLKSLSLLNTVIYTGEENPRFIVKIRLHQQAPGTLSF